MPYASKHPCRVPRCPGYADRGDSYCPEHRGAARREHSSRTGQFYNAAWRKHRGVFLRENPFCVKCRRPATVVDHIKPHRGDDTLFWDTGNWQAMCKRCHDSKTRGGE